ncbi:MAG: ATP-binding cassette domain-containing protein [Actinomycetota bacterium]|nr:ATP-binding cassette domain-containing protein [Actinomycetota bacterium]
MSPPPDATPAVVLDAVTHRYGDTHAVRDVDLSIAAGETVALVGPSGAGKTTVLRLIAGMLRPTAGRVSLHGQPLQDLKPGQDLTGLVGMVQQRLDLVPQLSVKHNVQAGSLGRWSLARSLAALLLPVEQPAARAAVRRVGIDHKFHQRVSRLSGGEQQRVALARLLVQEPRIVLADEPVASLDPARADDLLALLARLARESGNTLVASLHTPHLARRHFSRMVGLRDGRVVFDRPAEAVTAELLDDVYRLPDGAEAGSPPPPTAIAADQATAAGR